MIKLYEIIATWFYSGYLKPASGTWGTLFSLPLCFATVYCYELYGVIIGSLVLFIIGLWAANKDEIKTGEHDSSHVVIDETCGMMIASIPLLYQFDWQIMIACFLLFRLFDAVKYGPVGWLDKNINGAFGVMIDDVAAGLITTAIILGYIICM